MTRKKVKLAYINNDASRKATYKKRKKGLLKKVSELSTLCGVDACAIIYSPYDTQPEVYPSPGGVHRIVKKFKKMPEIEQGKKMMNQEVFLKQKIGKVSEQMKRLKKENRDRELNRLLYGNLSGKMNLQGLTVTDLNDLTSLIDQNLKDINKRMEELAKETKTARMAAAAAAKVPPLMNREVNSTSATTSTAYNNNRGGGMQRRQDLNTQNQANNNNAMKFGGRDAIFPLRNNNNMNLN
ncbi:agamous-like MADS-box protein AGL80 [Cannabis sativa]|uniref:agamous-like MADS-box protein AGL80 n=1 Tax=Cannabis sativa TaxID=3483 RepID=UPI0011DFA19A|nr:agamous-like MADS-box protein AGL80 [Cannabis sativa]